MNLQQFAIGLLAGAALAVPANAQYGAQPKQEVQKAPAAAPADSNDYKPTISSGALKAIQAYQTAVAAKDQAAMAATLPEAKAKAKTKDDRYAIARLSLQAAADKQDLAGMIASIEEIIASGAVPAASMVPLYTNVGKMLHNQKNFVESSKAFERVLQLDPNNRDALLLQSEALAKQGKAAEGMALAKRAIAAERAATGKVSEQLLRFVFALAYNNKLPGITDASLDLVTAYPSPTNWRDSLRIYQSSTGLDNAALIDVMRLAYATDALVSESDYYRLANSALGKGFPGEAKLVLESGFAKNAIDRNKSPLKEIYASAVAKAQGDRASLAALAKTALAAPTAKQAVVVADAYYGYGDYAQAIPLYRAALGKTGADKDLINLRLGMALARSGDKAGAKVALQSVGGAQVTAAKFWIAYIGG